MLTLNELRSSSRKELLHELVTAQKSLLQTRMGVRTKHQKDTSLSKKHQAYVARISTIIVEKDMEERIAKAKELE